MWFRLCLLFIGCALIGKTWHFARDGFRIDRCQPLEFSSHGQFSDTQTYRYLASGRQFYVFESLDGRFVVKLPRTDIYRPTFLRRVFPNANKEASRLGRKEFLLESVRMAAEELSEETGILAVSPNEKLFLIDRLGRTVLYTGPCVWQRKVPLLMSQLEVALQQDRSAVERMLAGLADVLQTKKVKGILTKDASFLRNFGFDGQHVYELDVGSFCHAPGSMVYARQPIAEWLEAHNREAAQFFRERTQ